MTNGNSAERERFEEWCDEPARRMTLGKLVKYRVINTASGYAHSEVIQAWEAWQGRAALSVCADGGKGDEHDSRMWDAGYSAGIDFERRRNAREADGGKGEAECAPLMNLLAVIHRDGGHYTSDHGIEKAAKDAEIEVIRLRSQAECAPREAQPVYDPRDIATPFADAMRSLVPTPERADAAPNPSDKKEAVCNCGATCQDNGEPCRYTVKQKAPIGEVEMTETGSRGVRWLTPEPPDEGTPLYTAVHLVKPSDKKEPEERNREHVRLNAEWMAKCEEAWKDAELPDAYTIYQLLLQRGGIPARRTSPENICDVIEVARAIRDLAKKEGA